MNLAKSRTFYSTHIISIFGYEVLKFYVVMFE